MSGLPRVAPPNEAYAEAFARLLDDYAARDPAHGEQFASARLDFVSFVARLRDEELGRGLPEGYVPCSHRWLIDDGEIVAIVRVRHNIDHPLLAREGGHIGYDVPPSHRTHGYGVAALRAGLDRARELGLERVLVCANVDNAPSRAVIERCGGLFESECYSAHFGCPIARYWIELAGPSPTG